jgi:hypothetical protein
VWKWEASGSVYTRDMQADEFNSDEIPSFVSQVFTPRLSTSASYAGTTTLNLTLSQFNAKAGYRYISPGYTSLGLPASTNDEQEFMLGAGLRFDSFNISIEDMRQNDNLMGQKLFTTVRNRLNATVNSRISNQWNLSLFGNLLTMTNNSGNDTTGLNFTTIIFGMNHTFVFDPMSLFPTVNVNYVYQSSGDASELRKNMESETHSFNLSAYMTLTENLNLSPVIGLISSKFGGQDATTMQSYFLTGMYRALENKLSTTLSIGASVVSGTTTLRNALGATYQLTNADMISVMFSNTNYSADTNGYTENMATLNISHRF